MPSRAIWSLLHCLFPPLYSALLVFIIFFSSSRDSDLPEPQLELGCGFLQHECWPQLCTIFQAQCPLSFDQLSLSALQFQVPGRSELIGSVSVRFVLSAVQGRGGLPRHPGYLCTPWHGHPGGIRNSTGAATEPWTVVWGLS